VRAPKEKTIYRRFLRHNRSDFSGALHAHVMGSGREMETHSPGLIGF